MNAFKAFKIQSLVLINNSVASFASFSKTYNIVLSYFGVISMWFMNFCLCIQKANMVFNSHALCIAFDILSPLWKVIYKMGVMIWSAFFKQQQVCGLRFSIPKIMYLLYVSFFFSFAYMLMDFLGYS